MVTSVVMVDDVVGSRPSIADPVGLVDNRAGKLKALGREQMRLGTIEIIVAAYRTSSEFNGESGDNSVAGAHFFISHGA